MSTQFGRTSSPNVVGHRICVYRTAQISAQQQPSHKVLIVYTNPSCECCSRSSAPHEPLFPRALLRCRRLIVSDEGRELKKESIWVIRGVGVWDNDAATRSEYIMEGGQRAFICAMLVLARMEN